MRRTTNDPDESGESPAGDPRRLAARTTAFVAAGARTSDAVTDGTDRVDVSVEASEPVEVRDVVPTEWTVLTEDGVTRVENGGDAQFVCLGSGHSVTATYVVEAPDEVERPDADHPGPMQVSPDGGETWVPLSDASDADAVVSDDTATDT